MQSPQAKMRRPHENYMYPQMPNKQNADYQAWKIEFEKILPDLDKDSILIGHSLGGIFLAKYLSENKLAQKLDSLHLVAAPYYKCGNFNLDLKNDPNKFNQNLFDNYFSSRQCF